MNRATFNKMLTIMGYMNADVAGVLAINERTVRKWRSGEAPVPAFAQVWIEDLWSGFLDDLGDFSDELAEIEPGAELQIPAYTKQKSMEKVEGKGRTLAQVEAMTSAQFLLAGLADLDPVMAEMPEE